MKKKKQKKTDAAGKYTRPAAGPGGSGPGISSGPYGEMEPNGDKRRGASAGPAVEQRNVPRQTPREYAGPHLSKAKMG